LTDDSKPRLLVLDIETAPAELWGWALYNQNFGVEQIKADPYILCVGYQWLGEGGPECLTLWELGPEVMHARTRELLQLADGVITKNGVKFDYPWIKAEFAKYKIAPPKLPTHIDLDKVAKKEFRFLSNKLDYILQYLDIGSKVDTGGFKLWREVMEGKEAARKKMVRYCKHDVRQTGRLYNRLKGFITNHPAMRSLGSTACPTCQSKKTKKDGIRRTACFHIQQHQCNDCGRYFSGTRRKVA
jgi:hypothetical protein